MPNSDLMVLDVSFFFFPLLFFFLLFFFFSSAFACSLFSNLGLPLDFTTLVVGKLLWHYCTSSRCPHVFEQLASWLETTCLATCSNFLGLYLLIILQHSCFGLRESNILSHLSLALSEKLYLVLAFVCFLLVVSVRWIYLSFKNKIKNKMKIMIFVLIIVNSLFSFILFLFWKFKVVFVCNVLGIFLPLLKINDSV